MLRALAVFNVLLFHFWMFPFGWIGVDLFFVISGFLIGGIILRDLDRAQFTFASFYWHRCLRILPVYYVAMVFTGLLKDGDHSLHSLMAALFLLQTTANYFLGWPVSYAAPGGSWSLVVEEHFYLLAPLIIVGAKAAAGNRGVAILAALAVASGPVVRAFMTSGFAADDANWHFASFIQFHSRYDEIAAGVLVACVVDRIALRGRVEKLALTIGSAILLLAFALSVVVGGHLFSPQNLTRETIWIPTALAATFGIWIFLFRNVSVNSPIVMATARLSYPLYLFHLVVAAASNRYRETWAIFSLPYELFGFYGAQLVLITYSLAFAYAVSLLVEFPFLRLYRPSLGKMKPLVAQAV